MRARQDVLASESLRPWGRRRGALTQCITTPVSRRRSLPLQPGTPNQSLRSYQNLGSRLAALAARRVYRQQEPLQPAGPQTKP